MRILIADKLPDSAVSHLESAGCTVEFEPTLKGEALTAALGTHNPEVLIVRSTKVTQADIEAGRSLSLIVRAGAGVNTIDLASAAGRGVYVANCPGKNATAVAELTWGHILNADRRISEGVADLKRGQWRKKHYAVASGLHGRTLGVLGCGGIGLEVIARARAFGMNVVAWSRSLTPAKADALGVTYAADPVSVASAADVLSVHLALSDETRGLVDASVFEALREGAIFVNTSRGDVVDEGALLQAIRDKGIRAGLDVFCDEPSADGEWNTALTDLDGLYGTHHIGASTSQAQEAVAEEACRIVLGYAQSGAVDNCVNIAAQTPATHLLVVRHKDQVGVLAGILDLLREAHINVEKMQNIIFSGSGGGASGAACARIQLVGAPAETLLADLASRPAIFDAKLVSLEDR